MAKYIKNYGKLKGGGAGASPPLNTPLGVLVGAMMTPSDLTDI